MRWDGDGHHGAPLAARRRLAAPVDAHRRPDPRLAGARRLRLPGRPRRGARRRRALGDHVHRRARLARPQGRPGGRARRHARDAAGHAPPRPRAEPLLRRLGRPPTASACCSSTRPTPTWPWPCGPTTSTRCGRPGRPAPARPLHPPHGARARRRGGARPRRRARSSSGPASAGPTTAGPRSSRRWTGRLDALAAPTVHHMLFTGLPPERGERAGAGALRRPGRPRTPCHPRTCPARMVTLERPGLRPLRRVGVPPPTTTPPRRCSSPGPAASRGGHDGWVLVPVLHDDGFRIDVFDAARHRRRPGRRARRAGRGHRAVPHPLGLGARRAAPRARARAAPLRRRPRPTTASRRCPTTWPRPCGHVARELDDERVARPAAVLRRRSADAGHGSTAARRRSPAAGLNGMAARGARASTGGARRLALLVAPSLACTEPIPGGAADRPDESAFTISDADSAVEALAGEDTTLGVIPDDTGRGHGRADPARHDQPGHRGGRRLPRADPGGPGRGRLRQRRAGRHRRPAARADHLRHRASRPRARPPAPSAWSSEGVVAVTGGIDVWGTSIPVLE